MPRSVNRIIKRNPEHRVFYLVDTCFLVYRYLPASAFRQAQEQSRAKACCEWWKEIDKQLKVKTARILVPNICIAETFSVFAQHRFRHRTITSAQYHGARRKFRKDIHLSTKKARAFKREILFHDIELSRDVVISVDRFFEVNFKGNGKTAGTVDLMLLGTAKYLLDFFDFDMEELFIVTVDNGLYRVGRQLQDIPKVFNPTLQRDSASKVFVD